MVILSFLKKSAGIVVSVAMSAASVVLFSGFSSESQQISLATHPELGIFQVDDLNEAIQETSLVTYDLTTERLTAVQALATGSAVCRDAITQIISNESQKISPSPHLKLLLQDLPETISKSSQHFSDQVFELLVTPGLSKNLEVFVNNERCGLVIGRAFPGSLTEISAFFNKLN